MLLYHPLACVAILFQVSRNCLTLLPLLRQELLSQEEVTSVTVHLYRWTGSLRFRQLTISLAKPGDKLCFSIGDLFCDLK